MQGCYNYSIPNKYLINDPHSINKGALACERHRKVWYAMKHELKISGMSCGMCAKRVEKALLGVAGVQSVSVDLATGTALVDADAAVELSQLKKAVEDSGYEVI